MFTVNARIIYAILFYILSMILIVTAKPSFIFNEEGDIKEFGLSKDKSLFSLGVFSGVLAILSFYAFAMIDLIFDK